MQLYAARMSETAPPKAVAPPVQPPEEDIEDEYLAKKPTAPQVSRTLTPWCRTCATLWEN